MVSKQVDEFAHQYKPVESTDDDDKFCISWFISYLMYTLLVS